MASPKRPLLSREQRDELNALLGSVLNHTGHENPQRAYATGVYDALDWLTGADPTPLLQEVTR